MYNEILPNLFLGDLQDAIDFASQMDGHILVVLEARPSNEPLHAIHIPILDSKGYAYSSHLNKVCQIIDALLKKGKPLLVHCGAGIERSPLTIVWYLHKYYEMTLEESYQHVITKRNQVAKRLEWLIINE